MNERSGQSEFVFCGWSGSGSGIGAAAGLSVEWPCSFRRPFAADRTPAIHVMDVQSKGRWSHSGLWESPSNGMAWSKAASRSGA